MPHPDESPRQRRQREAMESPQGVFDDEGNRMLLLEGDTAEDALRRGIAVNVISLTEGRPGEQRTTADNEPGASGTM